MTYTAEDVEELRAADAARIAELEAQLDEQRDMFEKCAEFYEDRFTWNSCKTKEQKVKEIKRRLLLGYTVRRIVGSTCCTSNLITKLKKELGLYGVNTYNIDRQKQFETKIPTIRKLILQGKSDKYIRNATATNHQYVKKIRTELEAEKSSCNAA